MSFWCNLAWARKEKVGELYANWFRGTTFPSTFHSASLTSLSPRLMRFDLFFQLYFVPMSFWASLFAIIVGAWIHLFVLSSLPNSSSSASYLDLHVTELSRPFASWHVVTVRIKKKQQALLGLKARSADSSCLQILPRDSKIPPQPSPPPTQRSLMRGRVRPAHNSHAGRRRKERAFKGWAKKAGRRFHAGHMYTQQKGESSLHSRSNGPARAKSFKEAEVVTLLCQERVGGRSKKNIASLFIASERRKLSSLISICCQMFRAKVLASESNLTGHEKERYFSGSSAITRDMRGWPDVAWPLRL